MESRYIGSKILKGLNKIAQYIRFRKKMRFQIFFLFSLQVSGKLLFMFKELSLRNYLICYSCRHCCNINIIVILFQLSII